MSASQWEYVPMGEFSDGGRRPDGTYRIPDRPACSLRRDGSPFARACDGPPVWRMRNQAVPSEPIWCCDLHRDVRTQGLTL